MVMGNASCIPGHLYVGPETGDFPAPWPPTYDTGDEGHQDAKITFEKGRM